MIYCLVAFITNIVIDLERIELPIKNLNLFRRIMININSKEWVKLN